MSRRRARSPEEAEDIAHEVLIKCMQVNNFKIASNEIMCLFSNYYKRYLRDLKYSPNLSKEYKLRCTPDSPLDILLLKENMENLNLDKKLHNKTNSDKNKEILCISTGEIFKSHIDACYTYNFAQSSLYKHLRGELAYIGRHGGVRLQWKRLTNNN